jgi:hypothetical protein
MSADLPTTKTIPIEVTAAGVRAPLALSNSQTHVLAGLFFLLVTALRLTLLGLFGADSPYSDQWGELAGWLRPFQDGTLDWTSLFAPHNEHRIVLERVLATGLFLLNDRQWDNLVQAALDVFLFAGLATLLFRSMLNRFGPASWPVPALLLVACCLPCGFENLLVGFQFGFYVLIALAVYGIWLCASRPTGIAHTLLAGVIAYVSLFALASGLFTAAAMAIAVALRLRAKRGSWLAALPLFAILASATVAGCLLLVPNPQGANLRAQDLGQWLDALRMVGSWPVPSSWLSFALVWLPMAVGGVVLIWRREADSAGIAALAAGLWTAAQVATLAYGRANDMLYVHSRYTDILAVGVLVNALFCLRLASTLAVPASPRLRIAIACAWLTAAIGGYAWQGAKGVKDMLDFAATRQLQSDNIRNYLLSNNPGVIDSAMPWNLPLNNKASLKAMLGEPAVRNMLPAGVRQPLSLGAYGNGFSVNGLPPSFTRPKGPGAYGSYGPTGNANTARMSSVVLHSRFSFLQFSVAGDLGSEEIDLQLQASDGSLTPLLPSSSPANAWKQVTAAAPAGGFSLRAEDASSKRWLAFTPPVEMGRLSGWTHRLLDAAPVLLGLTLLVTIFAAILSLLLRLNAPQQGGTFEPEACST